MIIIDAATSTVSETVFRDRGKIAPDFTIVMSSTGTVLIKQGDEPDKLELVGTITESGNYNQAAIKDFFSIEVTANGGTISATVPNLHA